MWLGIRRSVSELLGRKPWARACDPKVALLGYAREIQKGQAFHNGRTQPRTALLLVDGSQEEPLPLQVFGNIPNFSKDQDGECQPWLVLCTSLTLQHRPKTLVTAGALHKIELSEEQAAGDQHAQSVTSWWAGLSCQLKRVAFDVGNRKPKRRKRMVSEDASSTNRKHQRHEPNSLDRFLRAASDILSDEADQSEEADAVNAGRSENTAADPYVGWEDSSQGRNNEETEGPATVRGMRVSMFSPPASAIKSPGAPSSQSSDSSGPSLSQSPQAQSAMKVSGPSDITAPALYDRIKIVVETGDAATLTKRTVRQTLALEYGADFVKWNKAEINRCARPLAIQSCRPPFLCPLLFDIRSLRCEICLGRLITDVAARVIHSRNESSTASPTAASFHVPEQESSIPIVPDHPPPRVN